MSSVVLYCATVTILQFVCIYINSNETWPWRFNVKSFQNTPRCFMWTYCQAMHWIHVFDFSFNLYMYTTRMLALVFICSHIMFMCEVSIYKNGKLEQLKRKCKSCQEQRWCSGLAFGLWTKGPGVRTVFLCFELHLSVHITLWPLN